MRGIVFAVGICNGRSDTMCVQVTPAWFALSIDERRRVGWAFWGLWSESDKANVSDVDLAHIWIQDANGQHLGGSAVGALTGSHITIEDD